MPKFDGTGPVWGGGPGTGWGIGPCGYGRGYGRGFGRGYGFRSWTIQDQRLALEEEVKILKEELKEVEAIIQDIKKTKKKK